MMPVCFTHRLIRQLPLCLIAFPISAAEDVDFFETSVRPLLIQNCFECHSAEEGKTKGDLALDSRAGWEKGGLSGPAIVPGDADASLIIQAVRRMDPDTAMPPKKALAAEAVQVLERWVQMGAPDPREQTKLTKALAAAESLWSLKPLSDPKLPSVSDPSWPRSAVDAFLLKKLDENQLQPAADAPLSQLARRLWQVLIGLSPTHTELIRFRKEMTGEGDTEKVLARWVDELLARPQFGEKWGRHWLDLARYAESNGKALNNGLPYAWRYRDWVIAAINTDKPIDQFLTEQLAGDLLPASMQTERDALNTATGFLAIGSKEQFGGCGNRSVAEVQPEWVDDQLNVLGRGILGINIACSRCHDHKFDPVPMRDYYALAGIFFSTEILSGIKGGKASDFGQKRVFDRDAVLLGDPAVEAALRQVDDKVNMLRKQLDPLKKQIAKARGEQKKKLEMEIDALKTEETELLESVPQPVWTFGLRDAKKIGDTTIRRGGVWNQVGDEVPRGLLSAVRLPAPPPMPGKSSGRLELAQWLTHPEHPLTSRVFVNRIWHHVFGQGLVTTTDNFGMNGDTPSHPELLDFLAHRFVSQQAWSLKALVRDLVLSRAFRQASTVTNASAAMAVDPSNRLLWRMNTRRLEAEAIRDAVLAASGSLDLNPRQGTAPLLMDKLFGGISQKDIEQMRATESEVLHRAVYLTIIRNETLDETLAAFDFPNNDEPATQRETATVPAQALLLMNHPLVVKSARRLADEIGAASKSEHDHVELAFIRILGREPTADEAALSTHFLKQGSDSLAFLCQGLFQSAEFRLLP